MIYINYTGGRNHDIEAKLRNHFDGHKAACWDHGCVVGRDYNSISAMVVYVPEEKIDEPKDDEYIAIFGRGCYTGIKEASNKNIPTFFYDARYDRFISFKYRDVDIVNSEDWKNHACINYNAYTENDVNAQYIRDLNIGYDKQHINKLINCYGLIARVVRYSVDRLKVVGLNNDSYVLERRAKKSEKIYASKEQMLQLISHGFLQMNKNSGDWVQYKNNDESLLTKNYSTENKFRAVIEGKVTEIYINTGNSLTTMRKTHEVTGTYNEDGPTPPEERKAKKEDLFRFWEESNPYYGHVGVVVKDQEDSHVVIVKVLSIKGPHIERAVGRKSLALTNVLEIGSIAIKGLLKNRFLHYNRKKIDDVYFSELRDNPGAYWVEGAGVKAKNVKWRKDNTEVNDPTDKWIMFYKKEKDDKSSINNEEDSSNDCKSKSITSKAKGTTVIRQKTRARVAGVTSGRRRTTIVVNNHRNKTRDPFS